ncbi:hypothetical protein IH785_14585 [candidate division KSB1 bacterium]|nr:hypothetical protein [candidate division KSB1 bacterium]
MNRYKLYVKRFNYVEVVEAKDLSAAKITLLNDLGFHASTETLMEVEEVSSDEELDGNLKLCDCCQTAECRVNAWQPSKTNLHAYRHWVLKTTPAYALIPCLYQLNRIRTVKVSTTDYDLLYKFDWYINSEGIAVTIVDVTGKHEAVNVETIKRAVATFTEEYEKFGDTIYMGEWAGWDYRDKMDIAMLSIHGEAFEDRKLNHPKRRKQYLEYLEKNPAFLEKIKIATFIKRQKANKIVKKYRT